MSASTTTSVICPPTPLTPDSQLPSLEEYVLISSTQISVEIYRRAQGRFWLYTAYQPGDSIILESIDFECPIGLLYDDIAQFESTV